MGFVSSGVMLHDGEVVQMLARASLADDVAMQAPEAARKLLLEHKPAVRLANVGRTQRHGAIRFFEANLHAHAA